MWNPTGVFPPAIPYRLYPDDPGHWVYVIDEFPSTGAPFDVVTAVPNPTYTGVAATAAVPDTALFTVNVTVHGPGGTRQINVADDDTVPCPVTSPT